MPIDYSTRRLPPKSSYPRSVIHGQSKTRLHRIWTAMKQRCHNPKNSGYPWYGARGIKVCPRWRDSFAAFLDDMGHPPTAEHTIDRIDNHGDYEAENCKWATRQEQMRNTRNSRLITFNGETKNLADWASGFGITSQTLVARIQAWGMERALTDHDSYRRGKLLTYNGESKNLAEWSRILGFQRLTLRYRVKKWGIEKAFESEPPKGSPS